MKRFLKILMNRNKKYSVCVINGDGIGIEVISETVRLLDKLPISFDFMEARAGYQCYLDSGNPLPGETILSCKKASAILFGAVTTPPNIKNYFSPIVRLRKILHLFANVRPIFSLPLSHLRQNIDFIIVRENTEDLYQAVERVVRGGVVAERLITGIASKNVINFAFQMVQKQKRKKVTLVHKANILRLSDGLFLKTAQRIAKKYPDIIFEDMLVDSCAANIIKKPEYFDVIVTTNMFGDILSDEAAALVGGLGIAASANIGKNYSLFEPVHGSAPKHQGKNTANPVACFFAAVMMLEYLGERQIADKLRRSILDVIKNNCVTRDLGGQASSSEITDEVIKIYKRDYNR